MNTKHVNKNFFVPKNTYQKKCLQIYFLVVENFPQTFFVGGLVRDLLLRSKTGDVDIATTATPNEIINLLTKNGYRINREGIKFGVIKVKIGDKALEITSFRKETYHKTRYPEVTFTKSMTTDSKRRDFTMNALYLQAKHNIIYDPQEGLKDLKSRKLRLIGDPEKKLLQDPLRIIRAFRFLRDHNLRFDRATEEAVQEFLHHTVRISRNKIIKEIQSARSNSTKKFLQKILLSS